MRIAIIGRSEYLFETAQLLLENNFKIPLIITAKEAPEYAYTAKDFEALAKKCGSTFIQTPKINLPEIISQIKSCGEIDIAVSINYSGVIEEAVINLFSHGILNAHGGDLPRYRGNACMAWSIINGEKKVGLCIHKMIPGELDSGDIINRKYLDININTRVGETFDWMRKEIPGMMLEAVKKLQAKPDYVLEIQSKKPEDALRTYPRIPSDGKIDWTKSNEEIVRLVNASSEPFEGAYCFMDETKLTIWRASLFEDDEKYSSMPGQVARINDNGDVVVITGNGKILVTDVSISNIRSKPFNQIKSIRKRLM